MGHIRRRGLALAMVSGLAAGSMFMGTGPAAAAESTDRPHHVAEEAPSHETRTVVRGTTLWEIADERYGDGMKWWAVFAANAKAIEKSARAHGLKGSDLGHWIYPGEELAVPAPEMVEAHEKSFREALDHVLTRHPRLRAGTTAFCPGLRAPEDLGACVMSLLDQAPQLLEQAPGLLNQAPRLLEGADFLQEIPVAMITAVLEPLVTCVTEEENPVDCLSEALTEALPQAPAEALPGTP
ncbi:MULTISPECIES: LysM peptidoglycan-binding domain-containing protein [Streptomyces]|uniref:LysM domain-containing protein n=1 Tax=Streptomyces edwardsiae TaxID=3075527 RepID=A0ABU2QE29_9ACTN|nr:MULTISPECIES: hypothetical protein [unclassified Streptomyces]MDT0402681.1 hypothetical protein [Streptomyces sp. DSM 41635]